MRYIKKAGSHFGIEDHVPGTHGKPKAPSHLLRAPLPSSLICGVQSEQHAKQYSQLTAILFHFKSVPLLKSFAVAVITLDTNTQSNYDFKF